VVLTSNASAAVREARVDSRHGTEKRRPMDALRRPQIAVRTLRVRPTGW
jgi:hypothetical protein